ncbi:MAG: nuclear transport factor 2 family protein [Pseudomonadota bacterium]
MKKTAVFFAFALTAVNALAASPSETMAAFHAALGAGDRAAAIALLSPDIVIYESGFVEHTRDEYASHHLDADMAYCKATTRKILKHAERIDGNVATVMEETETRGSFKGKPVNARGLETTILEKRGDGWVVAHIHWSSRNVK